MKRVLVGCAVLMTISMHAAEPTRKELLERDGIIWASRQVWVTPYAENISENEKIAGLSRLWLEVKLNFPRFANVPDLDWDQLYFDNLTRVRATRSTYEYYKVLQTMMALLDDGHSEVFLPKELTSTMEAMPPVELDRIEGRVFIGRTASPSLEAAGLTAGTEIVTIDGTPVNEYADLHCRPYVGSNSPAHRELMIVSGLLSGPAATPVELELRAKDGRLFTRKIARTGYADAAPRPSFEFRELPGKIAYVALNSFADDSVEKEFERLLPRLREMNGLVIDVRENAGGSGVVAYDIIGMLMAADFPIPRWRSRDYIPTLRVWGTAGGWYEQPKEKAVWKGRPADHFDKPVVMLTGTRSMSATDVFAETFRLVHRGLIVGEPTAGSTGDPLAFALPGGGAGRVSTSGTVDDSVTGVGVIPDIVVPRTVRDVVAGRDAALDAAVAALRRGAPEASPVVPRANAF